MTTYALNNIRKNAFIAACVPLSVCLAAPAFADDTWEYTGFIYLWGAGIGGETVTGQDVDVSFNDVLDNLDFGLMGSLEARKGPWAIFGDALYLSIAKEDGAAVGPGIPVSADADISGFVSTLGAGYDVVDTGSYRLNAFGGLRYLDMDTTVNIGVGNGSARVTDAFSNWDGVVGLRGISNISDRWDLVYYADVGAGESDLTWQAALSVDYNINNWALTFGYRHLAWEIDTSATLSEIEFSGPFVGAKYRF